MPSVDQNLKLWSEYHWCRSGEEWSVGYADEGTGNAETTWSVGIWPRIQKCLPAGHVLEIAPGFGVWTQYLQRFSKKMTLVDLTPRCIDECRKRFGPVGMNYHVNDGRSLEMIPNGTIDFVFSWHSLVHCQHDVMSSYIYQIARKLKPGCYGMIQHSNYGVYVDPTTGEQTHPNPAGFGEDMTAQKFAFDATRAGLTVDVQEIAPWGSHDEISCFSLFHRPELGVGVEPPAAPVVNRRFWDEVRTRAQLEQSYGRPAGVLGKERKTTRAYQMLKKLAKAAIGRDVATPRPSLS